MKKLVNIAYQGGTHGNYLRFCIEKFSTLTPELEGTPFTKNNTAHKKLNYSGAVESYHPNANAPFFEHTDEPHIFITVDKEDMIFIERWSTIRNGDHKVDLSKNQISVHEAFLKNFPWKDKFAKYYGIDLLKNKIPKFLMRDFYKLSFMDLDKNGYIELDSNLRKNLPKNVFCFPVSSFWDKSQFFNTLQQAGEHLNLELDLSDKSIHDTFIDRLNFIDTKTRADDVIQSIQNNQDIEISHIDVVEQAYISAWIEKNNEFVVIPVCNQFFRSTGEIIQWLKHYPQHYKAMNPNLPKFNGIPNPFHLWNLQK